MLDQESAVHAEPVFVVEEGSSLDSPMNKRAVLMEDTPFLLQWGKEQFFTRSLEAFHSYLL